MDKVAIGSRLREARNLAKLTQEQLAEKVGTSHKQSLVGKSEQPIPILKCYQ